MMEELTMLNLLDPVPYYRASRWLYLHGVPLLPRVIKAFAAILFHCELPYTANIGPGFQVAYRGFGIVVHHRAEIGRNVIISPCSTIGGRSRKYEVPRIGNDVFIASGARILGDVEIGDGAVIGANAVVIHSVPPRSIAAGVPARIIRENINTFDYTGWPQATRTSKEKESPMIQSTLPSRDGTRVLMFIHSLDVGGSETQCVEVARQLADNGYSVTVGCLRAGGPLKARLQEAGLQCVEFPVRGSMLRPGAIIQMLKLVLFIRKRKFRVVHTNDLYSNLFAVPAAWLARVPVIISSRRDLSRWWWYTPARRKILRKVQELSTRILVNSEAVRRELVARDGFDASRITVVYNGIDVDKYIQAAGHREQQLPRISSNDKVIVMVGNMHLGVKGHSDLIEAARTVLATYPEARFLLAGDGEMRRFFEDQVRAAGLEQAFIFLGHRTDIPSLLSCCDVGVLASRAEGLPNAVLEYMAAGLPVVATSVGGVPEIIESEVSGLLVPPENPAALSAALLRLLENEELRRKLGKAGQERIMTDFSFSRVITKLNLLYEERPHSVARLHPSRQALSIK
jgi:glycosyltransferase involved in cell wall biosynthesis